MAVYVDDQKTPYQNRGRRMLMSHMVADSLDELHLMADTIGLRRRWYHRGHYNISQAKRALAVEFGAVEIDVRHAVMVRKRMILK